MYKPFRLMTTAMVVTLMFCGCEKTALSDMAPKAKNGTQNQLAPPEDPIVDCSVHPELCGPNYGGGDPSNTLTFSSTENKGSFVSHENPTGAIVMIAVIFDKSDVPSGWYLLDKNLNEGCSGYFNTEDEYLIFTRDPNAANNYASNDLDPDPEPITGIGACDYYNEPSGWDGHIWKKRNSLPDGHVADLNDGVGGEHILGLYNVARAGSQHPKPEIEIGVLRGFNNPNAQPPTGWTRYDKDLNAGAGGEYLYFCYKNR